MKCFYCGKTGNTNKGFEAVSEYRVGFSLHTSACKEHKELRRVFEMRVLEIYEKYYQKEEEASRGERSDNDLKGGMQTNDDSGACGSYPNGKTLRNSPTAFSKSPRNPESLTKNEERYVKDSLKDLKAGRFEVSDRKETTDKLLRKLKRKR